MKNSTEKYDFIRSQFVVDRKLYKYFSNIEYATNCIRKRQIHLDDPRTFNDPFDGAIACTPLSQSITDYSEKELVYRFLEYLCEVPSEKRGEHFASIIKSLLGYFQGSSTVLSEETNEKHIMDVIKTAYDKFDDIDFTLQELVDAIDVGFLEAQPIMHLNCKMSCFQRCMILS